MSDSQASEGLDHVLYQLDKALVATHLIERAQRPGHPRRIHVANSRRKSRTDLAVPCSRNRGRADKSRCSGHRVAGAGAVTASWQQHSDPAVLRPQPSRAGQRDYWETPDSLCRALAEHVAPRLPPGPIWEPASEPDGPVAVALRYAGRRVVTTDIATGVDFLATPLHCTELATNPPFNVLTKFSAHAVAWMEQGHLESVTLLWRSDHLGAAERAVLVNRAAHILVCAWRPRWIADSTTSPRFWFVWISWVRAHRTGPVVRAITPADLRDRPENVRESILSDVTGGAGP
jgi:hypothetical protein